MLCSSTFYECFKRVEQLRGFGSLRQQSWCQGTTKKKIKAFEKWIYNSTTIYSGGATQDLGDLFFTCRKSTEISLKHDTELKVRNEVCNLGFLERRYMNISNYYYNSVQIQGLCLWLEEKSVSCGFQTELAEHKCWALTNMDECSHSSICN